MKRSILYGTNGIKRAKMFILFIEDLMFVNPGKYDFTLKPGSPAFQLVFKNIDSSEVGPRKLD